MIDDSPFYCGEVTSEDGGAALVFVTDDQLRLLHSAHVVHVDAMFRVVLYLYHQLFTIFVPHAEYAFPACFALMTCKTTTLYEAVLKKLSAIEPQFLPTQVITDFQEAPTAALRNVNGNQLMVSGCWFHHAQALIKRLCKLGLTDAYRNDADMQTIFRCLLSLPLLLVTDTASGFQELKALLPAQSATSASMSQLLCYVERQWINKSTLQVVCA